MRFAWLLLILQDPQPKPWFGVGMTLESQVPEAGGRKFKHAIRVHSPVANSPADRAGLKQDDLIVAFEGIDFDVKSEELITRFRDGLSNMKVGSTVQVTIVRDWIDKKATLDGQPADAAAMADPDSFLGQKDPGPKLQVVARRRLEVLQVPVTLLAKPEFQAAKKRIPPDAEIFKTPFPETAEEKLGLALVREFGLEADYKDRLGRLAKLHEDADPWRLTRFAYAHRNPFKMPAVASELIRQAIKPSIGVLLPRLAEWLDRPLPEFKRPVLAPAGRTLDQRIDEIVDILRQAKVHYDKAFEKITDEEMTFLLSQLNILSESFTQDIYLDKDEKRERIEPNLRVIKLAVKVDYTELFTAAAIVAAIVEQAQVMREDLEKGLKESIVTRDTEFGKIVIAGKERHWHREDAAVIIDLGGDDFYTNNAGGSRGRKMPFAIVIDYEGDDAYESTDNWVQGCGLLGVGILADFGGRDSYIGQRWAQGAAALGVGILYDAQGNDSYRGWDYVQGAALWGIAMSIDLKGDDSYTATRFAQSCAMPGGFALLLNVEGNDTYYAKGKYPTSYGDAGLFDSWSQGCALGFRGLASGGIALLADLAGNDHYEAGHFSQGGGYYFGWGLLYEAQGNDTYMGSRYAQGFAAHEAMGYFEDASGNDRYGTRQSVAQGLSWDESVVAFIERSGDDVYDGGAWFSQGASAHNAFCLFVDYGGKDAYKLPGGQARAGPNDYHGGTCFSLFIDAGGAEDVYDSKESANNAIRKNGAHGFFVDLPGKIEAADLKKLIQK